MDLKRLQEQVVLLEARALELGMANPSPHVLDELRYSLHDVNALRALLPGSGITRVLRARADSIYAELSSIHAHWTARDGQYAAA